MIAKRYTNITEDGDEYYVGLPDAVQIPLGKHGRAKSMGRNRSKHNTSGNPTRRTRQPNTYDREAHVLVVDGMTGKSRMHHG